jgi:hypothetical protein
MSSRVFKLARQRRYRERQRRGEVMLAVLADEFGLIDALIDAGLLSERDAESRVLVEGAVSRLLAAWAKAGTRRWAPGHQSL